MNQLSKNSPERIQQKLNERAEILSRSIKDENHKVDPIEIIPFKLNKEDFALETKYVKEIFPLKNYTFLPCAPAFVFGLTNIRRRILPIIDLKVFFSIPNTEDSEKNLLIMENNEAEFAILINGFNSLRTLSKEELQTALPTLTGIRREFLKGLIIDGTVILDGQKLLTSSYLAIDISTD